MSYLNHMYDGGSGGGEPCAFRFMSLLSAGEGKISHPVTPRANPGFL